MQKYITVLLFSYFCSSAALHPRPETWNLAGAGGDGLEASIEQIALRNVLANPGYERGETEDPNPLL